MAVRLRPAAPRRARDARVLYVGNNWDGTADVVDPLTFRASARINIIPDIDERMAEIESDPERFGYYLAIRELVGEGHDQFVDDMFSSHDGRFLYVSRPSLADVVGVRPPDGEIVWRTEVEGTAPTTWRSRPTARACWCRPLRQGRT